MTPTPRAQRWAALDAHYEPTPGLCGEPGEAFLLVQKTAGDQTAFVTSNDRARLLAHAGDDLLRGWVPVALFDLDTGELTSLGVGPICVVPTTNPGRATNPLTGTFGDPVPVR